MRGPRPQISEEAARLLRQRMEAGGGDLFLESLDRADALALLAAARKGQGAGAHRPGVLGSAPEQGPVVADAPGSSRAPKAAPVAQRPSTTPPAHPASASPPGPAPSAAPAPGRDLPVLPDDYERLREVALSCTRCGLSETRTQVVFSDGVADARLMVVGEAPGANEDATGLPFVGAAGKFLDLLLACVDLSRAESVYIANVLKCRPPGNRNPLPGEIETCSPYLRKQIELVRPQALLAVGTFSAQLLTGQQQTLGRLRGTVHAYQGVPLVVTYHPAALLRNPKWTRPVWDDLQLLRRVLDGA